MKELLLSNFRVTPRRLFLVDGLGAIVSSFMLGVVLVKFQRFFGIPVPILYFLAIIPCILALYDALCFFFAKVKVALYLRILAILNVTYCVLSLLLAFRHQASLTGLGWTYMIGEVILVLGIAWLEWEVAIDKTDSDR